MKCSLHPDTTIALPADAAHILAEVTLRGQRISQSREGSRVDVEIRLCKNHIINARRHLSV